jgi:hypothetical protein
MTTPLPRHLRAAGDKELDDDVSPPIQGNSGVLVVGPSTLGKWPRPIRFEPDAAATGDTTCSPLAIREQQWAYPIARFDRHDASRDTPTDMQVTLTKPIGIMRSPFAILLFASVVTLAASCTGPRASRPRADSPEVIERVRSRVGDLTLGSA